ncbi:hypothetical protein DSL72_008188 [Monilinia vaccinii-corymbosi]|uniref:BTB domain-containing protein n=1 Tax=Monilinia vaccinii-corymbosi TaxID=61207 RepID=A0A8A3PJZ7_9HELO|nr:hypothetical protein DSL72_008188 [Monilinia vaccinii-corymbosi]
MMTGKHDLGSSDSPVNQRYEMQLGDITNADIRQKVETILAFYPSYPLLYLIYVLVRSNRTVKEARDFLEDTHRNQAHCLPVSSITDLEDIKDGVMRCKVEDIRTIAPSVTVWWAFYSLQVCNGDAEFATSLLFENVVDASKDPVAQTAPVSAPYGYLPISSRAMSNMLGKPLVHSQSDSESSVFGCLTPSQPSGNETSHTSRSSIGLSQQAPESLFINISEDEEDSATEKTAATFSASPDSNGQRAVTIGKGKGVAISDPEDYNSDTDMSDIPSFQEKPQAVKDEEKDTKCMFCHKDLRNWLAKSNHESSCRMRTSQTCVECKEEVSRPDIRSQKTGCHGLRASRRDGSEFEDRAASVYSSERTKRSLSRSSDIESNLPTEEELQKVKRMQEVFPHLTVDNCIANLKLNEGNLEEALSTEMDVSAPSEENLDRGSCSQQYNPLKRKLGEPSVERLTKKSRFQDKKEEVLIQPASQWIKSFLDFCQDSTKLTLVHLSHTESRSVPMKLMCDNSEYLKDMINPTGDQAAALKEVNLQDVEPAHFDAIIQFMVCRNVSFGPQPSEVQTVTTIINFIVLAERFKVAGPATIMFEPLEAILKQDRKGPYPRALKVGHVEKIFSTLKDTRHPIRKLFVRASVRFFLIEQSLNNTGEDDSDNEDQIDVNDVGFRNKPAHFAWKLNTDFGAGLLAKLYETFGTGISRPRFPKTRNTRGVATYYTDPFDDSQFTL